MGLVALARPRTSGAVEGGWPTASSASLAAAASSWRRSGAPTSSAVVAGASSGPVRPPSCCAMAVTVLAAVTSLLTRVFGSSASMYSWAAVSPRSALLAVSPFWSEFIALTPIGLFTATTLTAFYPSRSFLSPATAFDFFSNSLSPPSTSSRSAS